MILESAVIAAAAGYVVSAIKGSKGSTQAADEVSTGIWNWIRPIFIEEDKKLVEKLEENPEKFKGALELKIEDEAEKNEEFAKELVERVKKAGEQGGKSNVINVTGDGNRVYQDVTGNITDNSVTQTHTGTRDNIGRDKIVGK